MSTLGDFLESYRVRGIRLWTQNGQLHYEAPQGALSEEDRRRLAEVKEQLLATLAAVAHRPLTYTQLAHWSLYGLSRHPSRRQVAAAVRLRGHLSVEALRSSLAEVIHRHEALRTRIGLFDGAPVQEIFATSHVELEMESLTTLDSQDLEAEVARRIAQCLQAPVNVTAEPLWSVKLLGLGERDHVLILAMEHLVSDQVSLSILLRDLFKGYEEVAQGCAFSLPPLTLQFGDFAAQQLSAQRAWLERHGDYWRKTLAGPLPMIRFPVDPQEPVPARLGWAVAPLRIDQELKAGLQEWARSRGTTLALSLFSVYVGLVLRWCHISDGVIQYVTDGRAGPELENTIGFFGYPLALRVSLRDDDRFEDLAHRLRDALCDAYEHADQHYMAAQVPRPEFTWSSAFNWIPKAGKLELPSLRDSAHALECSAIPLRLPSMQSIEWPYEPGLFLFDAEEHILGDLYYPAHRFCAREMDRFGRNLLLFARTLVGNPDERIRAVALWS